ncbi:uncharacterized protein SAPINGB_P005375 [Magnusiomyces paraingens]|uniref:Uncharacterized protein n=1 Tax=Magnusiomyces paraingens TaxID=2606893 RepID=A0A5E8C4W9_9ASCO|nr:uncharacterized protein SAPINGB_P005375 [Saprochaete ingens]VVT56888.1 unnamed protein product [Saprochaete ingens]
MTSRVTVQQVMGRTSAYINLTSSEKLTPLNYHVWATKILLGLRAMNNGVHLYVEAGTVNPAANESLEDLTASLDTVVHDVILNNISPELIEHVNDVAIRGRDLWLYLHQEYSQLQPADVISLMKSLYAGNIDVGPKFVSSVRSYVATWRSIYQSLSPDSVVAFNALASMGPNCERFIQYALEHRFDSNNNTDNLDINNFIRNTDKWAKLLKITGPPATLSTEAFVASSKKYNNKSKGDGIKCFRCKRRGHTSNNCHVSWEEVQAARQDNKDDKESKEAKTSRGWFAETIDEFSEIVDDDPFVSSAFVSETSIVSEKFGNSCSESFDDLESELFDSSEPCVGDEDCFVGQVSEYCSNSGLDIDSVGKPFVGSTDDSCFISEPYVGSTVVCLESEPCVSSAPICFDSESLVDSDIVPFDSEPLVGSSFIFCSDSKPLVGSDDDIALPSFDFLVDSITEPSPPIVKPIVTPKSRFSPLFYLSFVTIMLFSLILIVVWHPSSILNLSHSVHHVFVAESTTSAEANLVVGSDSFDFIHDTGATSHICNNISYFSSLRPTSATIRGLGSATAEGVGDIVVDLLGKDDQPCDRVVLRDVLYVPKIPRNLFAARRATAGGCRFIQDLNHISAVENGKTRVHAIAMGDLYFCRFRVVLPSKPVHEVFAVESSANLWHKRLGHASVDVLKKLSKSLSVKPTHFEVVDSHKCDACLGGKATALPFNGTTEKASRPLELFVSDLSGPHVATPVGHRYVLTIMDYYSRYSYVELLVRKSDASLAIRNFIARCESYFSGDSAGDRVAYFHSDNGGEYISKDLEQFFVSKGIKHTYTVPHTPQQNGVAERLNRTLFEKAKSMLLYAHAPEYLWGEAVKSANYIRNRLPSRTTGGVAPLQLWTGKPPSYHHMKVFGCQATVVLPGAKRESKLSSNTEAGVFVGYSLDRTAYRVLLDSSIVEARSVYFDESKFPFMKSDKDLSINATGVGFSVGSGSGSMSGPCFDSKGTGLGSNVRVNSIASSDSSSGSSFGSHRSLPASSSGSGSGSGSGSICALPSPSPSSSPSHSPSLSSSSSSIIVHKPRSVRRILSTPSAPLESPTLPTLPSIPSVPSLPSSPILPPSDHEVSISPDSSPIVSSSEYIPSQLDLSEAGPSINESNISGDSGISQRGGDIGFQPSIIASSPTPPPSVELEVVPLSQESPSPDLVNSLDQAGVSVVTKDDTQAVLPKSRSRVVAVRLPSITPAKRPSSDDIVSPPSKHLCENSLKQSPVSATPAKRPAEEECISYRRLKSLRFDEEAEFWLEACVIEMSSLKRNGTWELVDLPPGRKAINSKWVFKVKRKADGSIERYKARLVCIGFSQVEGIDYTETFAPVVRYETVRIVLAIAAQFGFQVHHMDVETAFLNGDLKEDIYMRQPKGFVVKGQESKVCHLKKSLYGLKQAPLCWNEKIHGALVKLGFIRNESDYGVYTKGSGSTMVIIALYVDDLLISGNSSEVIAKTKSSLSSMFKMKDLGPVEQFLGMRVKQSPYHITVDVSRYIFDVLEEFGMQNCSSVKTPLPTRDLSDFSESDSATDASMYRSIIGKLIYAANCARPDLAVAVSFLCRYMQSPKSIHMEAAKHTLRYLKGTAELGLEYRAQKVYKLVGYSDADYAQDKQDRKSFTGPASSSVESEYMSLSDASKECFWINQLLSLCKIPIPLPVTMFEDNQGCIALAQNPVFHRRTKHIDVRYHVVRHYIRSGVIHLEYLDTQVMLADMFTKNLGRVKFETLRGLLGMKAVGDSATRGGVEHAMLSQTSAVDNAPALGLSPYVTVVTLLNFSTLTSSEKLTPLNYHVWATKILLGLRAMNNGVHLYVEAGTVNPAANESLEDLTASLDTVVHDVILNNISPELIEHVNDVAIRGRDLWLYLHQEYSQLQPADVISLMKSLYAGNIDVGPKFVSSVRSYVATWRSIYQSLSPDSVVAFNALASMGPNCERFIQYALEHRFDSNNNTDNLDINNFIRNTDKWAKLLKITGPPATLSIEAFVASSKKYNNKSKGDGIKCFRCKRRGHTSNNCHVSWEEVQAARQDNKDDKESKEAKTSRGCSAFVSETSVVSEKFGNSCSESFDDLESELFDSSEPCVGDEDCFVGQVSEYCSNSGLDIDSVGKPFVGSTDDSCFNSEPYVGSTVVCLESEPCVSSAPICFDSESLVDSDVVPFDSEPLVGSSFIFCSDSKPLVDSDDDIALPSFDFLVDSITEPSPPIVKPIVTPKSRFSPFFYLSFVTIMLFSLILIVVWHPSSISDLSHSVHHVFVAESTTSAEANLVVGSDSFDFIHDTGAC